MHLAALPNDPACDINPDVAYDINFLTTIQLAILAKRVGVKRFIYASSCSVYGVKGEKILNEEDVPAPITAYGFSKLYSEIALKLLSSNDFAVTCMRNATCYGVSPRMRFDMVLNNLVGHSFTSGKVKLLSDGKSWRPLVHIEDVAQAYIKAMGAPMAAVSSQVFSIGSENFLVREIAEIVKATVPNSEIEYAGENNRDWRSYNVDFTRAMKVLNFTPEWTVEKGAKELYEAYKEKGLTAEEFKENNIYWAGKRFRYLIDKDMVDSNLKIK